MTQVASNNPASVEDAPSVDALEQHVEGLLSRVEVGTDAAADAPSQSADEIAALPDPSSELEESIEAAIDDAKARAESIAQALAAEGPTTPEAAIVEPQAVPGSAAATGPEAVESDAPLGEASPVEAAADALVSEAAPAVFAQETVEQATTAAPVEPVAPVDPLAMVDQAGADVVEAMFGTSRSPALTSEQTHEATAPAAGDVAPATVAPEPEPQAGEINQAASPESAAPSTSVEPAPAAEQQTVATPVIVHAPPEAKQPVETASPARPPGPPLSARVARVVVAPVRGAASLAAAPLKAVSVEVRDLVGWFALVTLFNAACLWGFVLWKASNPAETHEPSAHAPAAITPHLESPAAHASTEHAHTGDTHKHEAAPSNDKPHGTKPVATHEAPKAH